MKTMKTLFIYLLLVVAALLITKFVPDLVLGLNYKPIYKYEIETESPKIEITEAKATKANGIIKGTITNQTDSAIENCLIKIVVLSDSNIVLGQEFLKAGNLDPQQSKEFECKFRYNNVTNFKISVAEEEKSLDLEYYGLIEHAETYYYIARFFIFASTPSFFFLKTIFK